MGKVILDMVMSLDGYISGLHDEDGGLHHWFFEPSERSREVIEESIRSTGAIIMGRRSYEVGAAQDGFADNPYQAVHVVLSHSTPKKPAKGTTRFVFVTDGIESALRQAQEAAGDLDVVIGGGATVAQQYINAGLLDEIQIHMVPVLLGEGKRLFDHLNAGHPSLKPVRVIQTPGVTHLKYRVVK